tara:strand:- start:4781 stop:5260 length:480 start_codon:yes stop_codon:yes gene_type:complete
MNDNVKIPENLEVSPISGKESVIVETVNEKISRICMDSGYMTNDDFSFDNIELIEKYEESMPQIIIDNKYKDEDLQQWWYLTTVQFTTGMIYPMPNSTKGYDWAFSPVVQIPESEQSKFPIPGKEGEFYKTRLDTEATERYTNSDFRGVCKRAGAVVGI